MAEETKQLACAESEDAAHGIGTRPVGSTDGGLTEAEERLANRIADVITKRFVDTIRHEISAAAFAQGRQFETCQLYGTRLKQFERFCKLMTDNPNMIPHRAAKAAMAEVTGHGGYTDVRALLRYAAKHRRYW